MERKKQASELLRWKRDLDAEEEKVLQLERTALQAWEGRVSDKPSATRGAGVADKKNLRDAKREETEKKGESCFQVWLKQRDSEWPGKVGVSCRFWPVSQVWPLCLSHPYRIHVGGIIAGAF